MEVAYIIGRMDSFGRDLEMVWRRDDRDSLGLRGRREDYGLTRRVVGQIAGRRSWPLSRWREVGRSVEIRRRDREFRGFRVFGLHFLERSS